MSGLPEEHIRQKPSTLPPLPDHDALTADHWRIVCALADTVIPSLTPGDGNRLLQHSLRREIYEASAQRLEQVAHVEGAQQLVQTYLGESACSVPEFKAAVQRTINLYLPEDGRKQLLFILGTLGTRAGALLLTGHASTLDTLPIETREDILRGWATARLPLFRQLHKALTSLIKLNWIRTSPTLGRMLAYPKTPVHDSPPGTFFPFTFLQIPPSATPEPEVIETDVVIVGSGCGGAVAAKILAESGLRVMVVDKSNYWPPEHLPMSESEGTAQLFWDGAALQSDDSSIAVLAGSAWGGGGTVNWSASLQPQGIVRREWAQKFGLTHLAGAEFQADLDAVCERMGVGLSAVEHNKGNQVLLEGSRKLGWTHKPVPQNTGGEAHQCGYCTLGCGSCGKKGPTETFLPDAAKAGASFVEGYDVQQIIFSDATEGGDRVVAGVRGTWTSRDSNGGVAGHDRTRRQLIIKAPRVILSSGTLGSPILLQKSGLKNPHIGRHLHLHPVNFCMAVWDEDIRPWEGPILTSVVNEFENLDNEGYGVKLEATTMLPGLVLPLFPWESGLHFKEFVTKMKRMTGYISLARDRYGGRVYPDPQDGRTRIQYHPSKYDKRHILEGVARLAELLYVEGAREILTPIASLPPFIRPAADGTATVSQSPVERPSVNDPPFAAWVAKLRATGFPAPETQYASAHQMGTCRMGTSPKNSVVDPRGKVWGTKGLYVCDASVFPSASGVNPMVTNMGISRGTARGIVKEGGRARL